MNWISNSLIIILLITTNSHTHHGEFKVLINKKIHLQQGFLSIGTRKTNHMTITNHTKSSQYFHHTIKQHITIIVLGIFITLVTMNICSILYPHHSLPLLLELNPLSPINNALFVDNVPKHDHFLVVIFLLFHHLALLLNPIVSVHNGTDHIPDTATDSHINHNEHISNKLWITLCHHIHKSLDP